MRGLLVDYCGVLDVSKEDAERWRALLLSAKANGVATAIVSNDPGGVEADHIRQWQRQGIVDAVILSGEVGAEKPAPEIFDAAADALDLPVSDCAFVDDSIENVKGAVEYGLVGVRYQHFDRTSVQVAGLFGIDEEF